MSSIDRRPKTPPLRLPSPGGGARELLQRTPEQVRKIEEARLRAKAKRAGDDGPTRQVSGSEDSRAALQRADVGGIQVPKKFMKYVEYDFSRMTDTKGGFLAVDDEPSRATRRPADERPEYMTQEEWERHQILKRLREQRAGPFEPGIVRDTEDQAGCSECGTLEIDWKWQETFGVKICNTCKDKYPEKYSLLTKSEARNDYLLTDPELKDEELLPRLERPNPHKSTWHNMQLYLRCQVEAYAFSDRKWGSAAKMDAEFERRESDKKRRKAEKFNKKLMDLKKRTRVEAYKQSKKHRSTTMPTAQFGDDLRNEGDRHEHFWGRSLTSSDGSTSKKCIDCGIEVEELEFD